MTPRILIVLAIVAAAHAQPISISGYNSAGGLGPTTTITPTDGGYIYSTIGGPGGGSWGGVTVTPGNSVSAAITPSGVHPIITPISPQIPAPAPTIMPMILPPIPYARSWSPIIEPTPIPIHRGPIYLPDPVVVPPEITKLNYLIYQIGERKDQNKFWHDMYQDFHEPYGTTIPPKRLLPYVRLWLRLHGYKFENS